MSITVKEFIVTMVILFLYDEVNCHTNKCYNDDDDDDTDDDIVCPGTKNLWRSIGADMAKNQCSVTNCTFWSYRDTS